MQTLHLKKDNYLHRSKIKKQKRDLVLINLLSQIVPPKDSSFSPVYIPFTYWQHHKDFEKTISLKDGIATAEIGQIASPLNAAIYSLVLSNDFICFKDQQLLDGHLVQLEYLKNIVEADEKGSYWLHKEDIHKFDLFGEWSSGITQGIVSSALLRAYYHTGEKKWLSLASQAIDYCFHANSEIMNDLGNNEYWIEEYPNPKAHGVLNGYLFFLIALAELNVFENQKDRLQRGIQTLINYLPSLQFEKHLKYAIALPQFSNILYRTIHYFQLLHLSNIIQSPALEEIAKHWSKQLNWKLIRQYFNHK